MIDIEKIEYLKAAHQAYENMRYKVAKEAYTRIKEVIDAWQDQEIVSIDFFWDGVVEVDGQQFNSEDFEDKDGMD